MNSLETYYTYSKLAQAAYIDLSSAKIPGGNPFDIDKIVEAARNQDRVPQSLAKNIFGVDATDTNYWTMLSPYYKTSPSTGHSDPSSGFAAMLLSNPTYGKVLAIAGTEPTAEIRLGDQTVMEYLLSPVRKVFHEAARER